MLVPFVCLLFWCGFAQADSLQVWHPRNPTPTQAPLLGVAYGNGTYVAVGSFGAILNSSNGIDWANCNSGTTQNLNAVTFGKGRFVVGGNTGLMLWSTNGVNWTNATLPLSNYNIDGLGYGTGTNFPDGLFVAMVWSNNFAPSGDYKLQGLYSSNAVDWFLSVPPPFLSFEAPHSSVTFGNNTFASSALFQTFNSGFRRYGTYYSSSGVAWKSSAQDTLGAITYGNGLFVMADRFLIISNVLTLNFRTTTNPAGWPSIGSVGNNVSVTGRATG